MPLLDGRQRLRSHFGKYEPVIDALKKKYEAAVRAKALMALERDKLRAMVGRPYHMCSWIPLTMLGEE